MLGKQIGPGYKDPGSDRVQGVRLCIDVVGERTALDGDGDGDPHLQGARTRFGREFSRLDGGGLSADGSRLEAGRELYYQGVGRSWLVPYIWFATGSANRFMDTEVLLPMRD